MRDPKPEEIGHVYGAGGTACSPGKPHSGHTSKHRGTSHKHNSSHRGKTSHHELRGKLGDGQLIRRRSVLASP